MQATTLEELFFNPGFLSIFLAILITIGNVIIGVGLRARDERKTRYTLHRTIHGAVVVCFAFFLWVNHSGQGNSFLNYFVFLYFLIVIPMSRKVNVTLHSVIASVGLALLMAVATLSIV